MSAAILPSFPAAPSAVPDVLSPSSVSQFQECSAKWYYRKVLELPEVKTPALALGSAVHRAVASNFSQKVVTHVDMPYSELAPIFRESFADEFDTVPLEAHESAHDYLECGEAMLQCYLEQAAPSIQPAAVELAVEGVIGGVKAHGFVDVVGVNGEIIDLKTSAKKPSGVSAAHRLQCSTYVMITPGASGIARRDVLTKTKTVAHYATTFDISAADRRLTERLYSITLDQMRSGLVSPNRGSFMCSKKNCSYWETCEREYGGTVNE